MRMYSTFGLAVFLTTLAGFFFFAAVYSTDAAFAETPQA
jgi:hypothetical protein